MDALGFGLLKEQVSKIEALCCATLGANEIDAISLDEPDGPLDELYFRKVVAWCYSLLFENGIFFRFSKNLLRSTNPDSFRQFQKIAEIVRASRTVHGHNLRSDRASDQDTRRRYDIWLRTEGGRPTEWERCIVALIGGVCESLSLLEAVWTERCSEEWSRQEIVNSYHEDKRNFWEAHEFDRFVESAATELGLTNFDCVQFRNSSGRLERWRELVGCFQTRPSAEDAVGRAIFRELIDIFGSGT